MYETIKNFLRDEEGLELSEYAVMTAMIVALLVTTLVALGGAIEARFTELVGVIGAAGN